MNAQIRWLLVLWLVFTPLGVPGQAAVSAPAGYDIYLHPDGGLQVGDQVSFDVFSPAGADFQQKELEVELVTNDSSASLGKIRFDGATLGRFRASLYWVWNTTGLNPGDYRLRFTILPEQTRWEQSVSLAPTSPDAGRYQWAQAELPCCVVHYVTATRAERDLPALLNRIQSQAEAARTKFSQPLKQKIHINLLPRVLGQGGFAGEELYISYPERNFTGIDLGMVLHHEIIHRLDAEINQGYRPSLLVEGIAVYLSGGHYQPEPILARAVALRSAGMDLPLPILAENFYDHQHETSYIQAGALVDYLVKTWGWQAFLDFYGSIKPDPSGSEGKAIGTALLANFGWTLKELDDRFGVFLESQPVLPDLKDDLELTIEFYERLRIYQQQFDPSAYFQQVWLPDAKTVRERQIVADYLRSPALPINEQLENLLAEAGRLWRAGDFNQSWAVLGDFSDTTNQK